MWEGILFESLGQILGQDLHSVKVLLALARSTDVSHVLNFEEPDIPEAYLLVLAPQYGADS